MAQHQRHPGAGHGRRRGGPVGPSRHPDGAGPRGVRALDPLPAAQSRPTRTGPTATASCSPAATPRCCCTRCSTSAGTTSRSTTSRRSGSGARARRAIPSGATRPASRPPPARWARASATRSAWRSPSACWPSSSTGRATDIVDHRTWAFVSDGDLMEGVASEAASLAGHLRLGKLTLIYDDNHITIDGDTALAFSEDVPAPLRGLRLARGPGRRRQRPRGDRGGAARRRAPRPRGRRSSSSAPYIADPAPTKRNTAEAHGAPLGAEEVRRTKEILGWPTEPAFYVPEDALAHWRDARWTGARRSQAEWRARLARLRRRVPRGRAPSSSGGCRARCPTGWDQGLPVHHARRAAARHPPGLGTRAAGDRRRGPQPGRRLGRSGRQHRDHAQAGRHVRAGDAPGRTVPLGRARARHGRVPQRHRGARRAPRRSAAPSWSSPTT